MTNYFENIANFYVEQKNNSSNLDIYIIHCKDFKDREEIIHKAIEQLKNEGNKNIEIFESVNTSKVDLTLDNQLKVLQMYDKNLNFDNSKKFTFYKSGQIGCYLGHHLAIKNIFEKMKKTKNINDYSIIFEDDILLEDNFTKSVKEIIDYFEFINETFDVIYLGHLNDNKGTVKHNNIYNLNKQYWNFGAHGLLVNNKSVEKLYRYNCNILHEIDNHYKLLYNKDLIHAYYMNKALVKQNRQIFSYINLKTNNY